MFIFWQGDPMFLGFTWMVFHATPAVAAGGDFPTKIALTGAGS